MNEDDSKAMARFWSRVQLGPDCWLWQGPLSHNGYGQHADRGRPWRAHRLSWELLCGPIPPGLQVLHTCDVRRCVNPAHLWLGTPQDNMDDKMRKGRHRAISGEQHYAAKLTDAQVAEARARYEWGSTGPNSTSALAREYGVSHYHMREILKRRKRK